MGAELDLRFLAFHEPRDIFAMHDPDEGADKRERKDEGRPAEKPRPEGAEGRGSQGRERGDAEEKSHEQPDGEEDKPQRPVEAKQDPDIGGNPLATLEAEPNGKQMAGKGGKAGNEAGCLAAERLHDEDGYRGLQRIGNERQSRDLLVAGA